MRRVPASWARRLWSGRRAGVAALGSTFGICGTVVGCVSAAGTTVATLSQLYMAGGCCAIGLAAAYLRGRMKLLPDAIVDEMSADVHYVCRYPSAEGLAEACEMTRPYYGHEYVSAQVAEQWRRKNPKAFVEVVNEQHVLCATFGVLGLTESFFDQYLRGRLTDSELTSDDILSESGTKRAPRLYISGVVVRDPEKYCGHKRTRVMLWCMLGYLRTLLGRRRAVNLYALSVTAESERLLTGMGFRIHSHRSQRKDRCDLYFLELTRQGLEEMEARVGDLSAMCTVDWRQGPPAVPALERAMHSTPERHVARR